MRIKGWKQVFVFTFNQQVKTKSFIIGTVVMAVIVALIAFLADFLPVLFLNDDLDRAERAANGENIMTVETLYISNETKYSFSFDEAVNAAGAKCSMISASEAEAKAQELENSEANEMLARITNDEAGFVIESKYAGKSQNVQKSDCEAINSILSTQLNLQYLSQIGVPESELGLALSGIRTTISAAGEEPVSFVQEIVNMVVPMLSSIVLFVFIFSYSQLVAQSVAIEKSSRIIEYLLTSIKPLAIILGKVLAMCCVSLLQFLLIGLGGTIGFIVSLPFGIVGRVGTLAGTMTEASGAGADAVNIVNDIGAAFSNVDITMILIMLVTFILGFLLFAGLAGLAGASVSKMEDLANALQPISLIGVFGFYLAYFPQVAGEENSLSKIARYLPISSPFILTSDYMLGKAGIVEALISILILAAAVIVLMMFVAKVYESIILHTGNRLKIGDMLKMSK